MMAVRHHISPVGWRNNQREKKGSGVFHGSKNSETHRFTV
jgi:hypothetical protein